MKKILFTIGSILVLFITVAGILYFLPNEISFKIYNAQAISQKDNKKAVDLFKKASKVFPNWSLISMNNSLRRLYKDKKYDELSTKLNKVIGDKCNTKDEQISQYCENIFYLNGLVQYRLGENKEIDEQKKFFQEAIDNFQKTLIINQDNKWAQENIDFIINKFKQNKQKQDKKENKDGKNDKTKKDKQGQQQNNKETNGNSTKSDSQKDKENNDKGKGDNQKGNNAKQNKQQQKGEDKNASAKQNGNKSSDKNGKSRLPKDVQEQLDEYQKQLDQEQNQKGFNRSRSAAQKNNLKNQNPLSQIMDDPFFRNFFGNDPMIQNQFEQKNLNDTITNPNEKDW